MAHDFIVTDESGVKHNTKAGSYVLAAKMVADKILKDNQETYVSVKGKNCEKDFTVVRKEGKITVQDGGGWNQTIKTQTGGSVLRKPKSKQQKLQYTGKNKNVKGKKHKEAVHFMLGNGFIPDDLQLTENPLKPIRINKFHINIFWCLTNKLVVFYHF